MAVGLKWFQGLPTAIKKQIMLSDVNKRKDGVRFKAFSIIKNFE